MTTMAEETDNGGAKNRHAAHNGNSPLRGKWQNVRVYAEVLKKVCPRLRGSRPDSRSWSEAEFANP